MNPRHKRKVVRKLQGLRAARLSLAELAVARARQALDDAQRALVDEEQRLRETVAQSHVLYRELDLALQARKSMLRESLYEWRGEREKVAAGVDAARERVEEARRAIARAEQALDQARGTQRAATVNVEKTKLLGERMQ